MGLDADDGNSDFVLLYGSWTKEKKIGKKEREDGGLDG